MSVGNGKRILIIEDNDVLGDVINSKLRNAGYATLLIKDGKEGYEQIDQFSPDLILLDILLPSMNGYEILQGLNDTKGPGMFPPIIVISNSGQPVEINKVLGLGAKDYLVKVDFTPEEVLKKVDGVLDYSSAAKSEDSPLRAEGFKILVVEDDNFLRDLLARKLTHEQYNLLVAADGEEGIELAKSEHPSVVLLDLILPGIDGFEVLAQIRKDPETKDIPVIVLSNLGQESDIEKAKRIGADEFLIKANFNIDEVIGKMQKLITDRKSSAAEGVLPTTEGGGGEEAKEVAPQ